MEFQTTIPIRQELEITHHDKVMMFGSCFSSYMGERMSQLHFDTLCNPLGILFNPISTQNTIQRISEERPVTQDDVFLTPEGTWNSYDFHSQFAQLSAQEYLDNINPLLHLAHSFLRESNYLFITLGTAWYYEEIDTKKVVANCHKMPAKQFNRKRLSVEACTESLKEITRLAKSANEKVKIVFTVSPIRHWKDGAHGNQVSKSTLLLAIDNIIEQERDVYYFPSYEIVLDELRDYRYYAEDMLHPSPVAQKHIWDKFALFAFGEETRSLNREIEEIERALNHRPFNPNTAAHQQFICNTRKKIEALLKKHPEIIKFAI